MKLFFAIATIVFALCSIGCAPEHEMKLTGAVDGLKKGTLLLQKIEDTTLISIDSIQINGDASFQFSTSVPSPEVYYLYLRLKNGDLLDERIPFFAEEGEITISTTLENFGNEYTITGSENQEKLEDYTKIMKRFADKNLELVSLRLKALAEKNDSVYLDLAKKEDHLFRSKYLASVNFALAQKDFEIAPYVMVYEVEGINKKFLDTVYNSLPQNIKNSKYGKDLESVLSKKQ